jgi:hypothetical protein
MQRSLRRVDSVNFRSNWLIYQKIGIDSRDEKGRGVDNGCVNPADKGRHFDCVNWQTKDAIHIAGEGIWVRGAARRLSAATTIRRERVR